MKILIATDSFKGTFSSEKAGNIIKNALNECHYNDVTVLPVSDGGDGLTESLARVPGCVSIVGSVKDTHFTETMTEYVICGDTAVIETAQACGLRYGRDVMNATTYGVGQLILSALSKGAKRILLGLGGSGTNDGGTGMVCALGGKFYKDKTFIPVGRTLSDIIKYDLSSLDKRLADTEIIGLCDVDNVFYGKDGASLTFSRQKGASQAEAERLDDGMKHLASLTGIDLNSIPGSGAAGGLGGGIVAFLGGKLKSGFDEISSLVKLEKHIEESDIVITGEGKTDSQTSHGKLPSGVASLCKKHFKPCLLLSGSIDGDVSFLSEKGISYVFSAYDKVPSKLVLSEAETKLHNAAIKLADYIASNFYISSGDI